MRICFLLAIFTCSQTVVAASTFVGQTTANFRVTERLDGTTTTANKIGTFNISLTTDYSTMRWSLDFDVDLLMSGGPTQSFETRLLASGSVTSRRCSNSGFGCSYTGEGDPSPLSFPDANGRSGAGSYVLMGSAEWTLRDRIVTVIRERTSPDKAIIASGYIASGEAYSPGSHYLSVLNYPSRILLTPGLSADSSWQNQSGQWVTSTPSFNLGRIIDGSNYLEVAVTAFPTTVTLIELLPGDFNDSSQVDAADYVLWRKSPGLLAPFLTNYDAWSENFGDTLGSGVMSSNVPEPSAFLQISLGLLLAHGVKRLPRRA